MKNPFDVENPAVETDNDFPQFRKYYFNSYHCYFEEDDEPDWDAMSGGHDDYSDRD